MDILLEILSANVWPLCFLLVAFVVLRQVKTGIEPIFQGMAGTLKMQATRYAMAWALAMMYAAAASLNALGEVADKLHWAYVAAFAKVVQPAVVAVIAYVNKAPSSEVPAPADPK